MCGLVGIFESRDRRAIDRRLLEAMTDSLAHRGPDGEGFHLAEGIGLGHRRLSIIDLAGGQQPMYNEDRSVSVVYNGEIYNFKDLARDLRDLGHVFRNVRATEVIVHDRNAWGPDSVRPFRRMLAFSLCDRHIEPQ